MQRRAKRGDVAEFGIGEDGRQREARGARLPERAEGEPPLFLRADRRGNARLLPRFRRYPFLGQIQRSTEAPRTDTGPQRRRYGHLAIGNLAQRATVLTGHADR